MPFIIFFGLLFVIGGIAWAFNVSAWAAFLILLGFLFVAAALYAIKDSLKSDKGKKVIKIILIVALIILGIIIVRGCAGAFGDVGSDSEWDTCMKCGGDGKYVNDIGFNVTCPRCDGVGYIYMG